MSEVNGKASADAGEVERMRAELAESEKLRDQAIIGAANNLDLAMNLDKENERLRAKLAERDAQLREAMEEIEAVFPTGKTATKLRSYLSTSTEPSAPVERDERSSTGFDNPDALRLLSADHCKECGHPDCSGQCYGDDMMGDS